MLIIPAIDLEGGYVVRYVQGSLNKKIYSRNPLKTAKHWVSSGAKMLHIVDLDGALTGEPKNLDIVKDIARQVDIPLQFGGGVRRIETMKKLFDYGVSSVVLGTKAVSDPVFLKKAFVKFKHKVIVSIDAKEDKVATKGWRSVEKNTNSVDFAAALKKIGFNQVIYTDVLKDGTLSGPNIKGIKKLLKEAGLKIIASGGISSLDDIYKLKLLEKQGVIGVIIGKALYEGRFTLPAALRFS